VGNQARERCTVDHGIGILEVVGANVVSEVFVAIREPNESLASSENDSGIESESDSGIELESDSGIDSDDDLDLACSICNSNDGNVNRYTLVDGRIACATCRLADDTLPEADGMF